MPARAWGFKSPLRHRGTPTPVGVSSWIAEYEGAQKRGELDAAVDMRAAVMMLWSIELGLGVIEALGLETPDADAWADLTDRLIASIEPQSPRTD